MERGERHHRRQAGGQRGGGTALGGKQVQGVLARGELVGVEQAAPLVDVPIRIPVRVDPVDDLGVREERDHGLKAAEHAASGFRRQRDHAGHTRGDARVARVFAQDVGRRRVALVGAPPEHVGHGTASQMRGEQVVGELLGGGAGEEVVAAGLRLARRVTPAVGDAFRVGDGLHRRDQVPHPRRALPVRVRDAFGVERPYPAVRMVEPADRGGHVEDVALVRGRKARARSREHGRDRVAQGLAGTRARQNDRHVLPAGVHRRVVHDVEPQRIARRHALSPVVRFYEP